MCVLRTRDFVVVLCLCYRVRFRRQHAQSHRSGCSLFQLSHEFLMSVSSSGCIALYSNLPSAPRLLRTRGSGCRTCFSVLLWFDVCTILELSEIIVDVTSHLTGVTCVVLALDFVDSVLVSATHRRVSDIFMSKSPLESFPLSRLQITEMVKVAFRLVLLIF